MAENLLYFGLGAINLTRERAQGLMKDLVARGEVEKQEASALVARFLEKGRVQREEFKQMLRDELQHSMPASEEVQERLAALEGRLSSLEEKLEQGHNQG